MDTSKDTLILADCLTVLKYWHSKGHMEFIDLCYIDPPFNSKRDYNIIFNDGMQLSEDAFSDIWSRTKYTDELENLNPLNPNLYSFLKLLETTNLPKAHLSYLTIMGITCWYIREMLKPTGSFYYHCDPTMSHYIKIMLDYVFGGGNFRNEIVWFYRKWPSGENLFQQNHDIMFRYSKTDNFIFSVQYQPHSPETIKRWKGKKQLATFNEEGKRKPGQALEEESIGVPMADVWSDINIIAPSAKERLGYPTQKPEALLERIIKASTNPNDLVADLFMGGGTTVATAAKLGRRFLGSDINERALQITQKRLEDLKRKVRTDFTIQGIPKSSKQLKHLLDNGSITKYEFQDMICKYYIKTVNVIPSAKKSGDDSIDGLFGFTYQTKPMKGIVQVTTSATKNHLKAFCLEVEKSADMGVYISFADKITDGMIQEVKTRKRLGPVDRVQILTVEDLVDKEKQIDIPKDILTI